MFAIARKSIADQTRGWLRRRALAVRLTVSEDHRTPDRAAGTASRIDLERAWRTLSTTDREVLALIAFDGLTSEQAAIVLNCRRSAFAMRLARARKRLRAALGWWGAWWPGPQGGEAGDNLTVIVHAGGRSTSYRRELP